MATITISRQMGSLGCQVSNLIAEKLGYKLVWRDLINQAARRSGTPEAALSAIDELGLLGISPSDDDCLAYQKAVKEIMIELWHQGDVVIIGRAGQIILKDFPNVLHVRLIASPETRAKRVAERHNIKLHNAQAQVLESDNFRKSYLKRCYGVDWGDAQLYHLVINTTKLEPASAVLIIETALLNSLQIANNLLTLTQDEQD